jgi:hypothetical protein
VDRASTPRRHVAEQPLDKSPGFRETRFQILRGMHPCSPDDEIEKHCRHILDPPNLGPRPAWLDKLSPADLNNDLSAGITATVAKSEAYKRAGYRCEHCGVEQNYVTPQGSVGVPILPVTPASSKASRAADLTGLNPLIGHPLGTIQRLVPRVVTKRISNAASWLKRYGRAPYCTRTVCFLFRLRGLLELPTFPFFDLTRAAPPHRLAW